jgi:translation initiation factor 2 alpha subunit (eIF-2alpha)
MSNIHPRVDFYENDTPKVGDFVVVHVNSISDIGVHCNLLEYKFEFNGMINFREVSKKRQRNIKNVLKENRKYVCVVLAIDNEYVDLSRRQVSTDDENNAWDAYKVSKMKQYHLWNACKLNETCFVESLRLIYGVDDGISPTIAQAFFASLKKEQLKRKTYLSYVQLKSYTLGALENIRRVLKYGTEELQNLCNDNEITKFQLVASPKFLMSVSTSRTKLDVKTMFNDVIQKMKLIANDSSVMLLYDGKIFVEGDEMNHSDESSSENDDE